MGNVEFSFQDELFGEHQCVGANAGWRAQFRFRGRHYWPGVVQLEALYLRAMENPELLKVFECMLRLTNDVLPKRGFIPTAALLDNNGEISLHGAPFENRAAAKLLGDVIRQHDEAGTLRASGIMFDVLFDLPDGSGSANAIVFILEHQNGDGVLLHRTYKKKTLFRKFSFGEQYETPLTDQFHLEL